MLLIIARLSEALDTLPLHEVSPDVEELLRDFFEQKWLEGKLTEMWTDEDIRGCGSGVKSVFGAAVTANLRQNNDVQFEENL